MGRLKRITLKLFGFVVVLFCVNYFFAHISFNEVMTKFSKTIVPPQSHIAFSSYFSFIPKPAVVVDELSYNASDKTLVKLKNFTGFVELWPMIKQKTFIFNDLKIQQMTVSMEKNNFDSLMKSVVFKLIREGLGVPTSKEQQPIKKFTISNLILQRVDGEFKVSHKISQVLYDAQASSTLSVCFSDNVNAEKFYREFIAQYVIAAKIDGKCVLFNKFAKKMLLPDLNQDKKP